MFASFFKATPPAPFDACPAFQKILPLISSLFQKEIELKNAATQPDTLSFKKYGIISALCENIRRLQNDFNNASKESTDITKNLSMIFADELKPIVDEILTNNSSYSILREHRDHEKRILARKAVETGTKAAFVTAAAAISTGLGVWALAGSLTGATSYITKPIEQNLCKATGLIEKKTKGLEILESLAVELEEIIKDNTLGLDNTSSEIEEGAISASQFQSRL